MSEQPMIKHRLNRPGQSALRYRVGTQPTFLRRMLEQLSRQEIPAGEHRGERPLAKLATRESADPAIALLDTWATAADVLTFYQERIADEGFLRTAGERRSVLELARAVGYELTPGVAARAWLAFDVDDPPGVATVPAGTQVMSIPGQDQRPQTFETSREFVARAAWNRLASAPPALTSQILEPGGEILLHAASARLRFPPLDHPRVTLQPGDPLLVVWDGDGAGPGGSDWWFLKVRAVRPEAEATAVACSLAGHGGEPGPVPPISAQGARVFTFRSRASLFGHNAPDWSLLPNESTLTTEQGHVVQLGLSKRTFVTTGGLGGQWPDFYLRPPEIDLDAVYPRVVAGSWIVLADEGASQVAPLRVGEAATAWREDFTLRSKVTRIVPDADVATADFGLRETMVFADSEELELAHLAAGTPIHGTTIELAPVEPAPEPGQVLVFAEGEAMPGRGEAAPPARTVFVESVEVAADRLRVTLEEPGLAGHVFDPATVVIYGNVVDASHGETVREVLGSGDSGRAHQRFVLRVPPLTHLAAGGGPESTLEVRVDDVLWHQASSFFGRDGKSRSYVVQLGDDGVPTLSFGDGVRGARLPSGQENVTATYRSGSGPAGNVAAGSLALLRTRPLGVRAVINPLPASGGAPADDLERARSRAPMSVRTLERLVSLTDYETFALAFPGVGKARADLLPAAEGGRQLLLTVTGLAEAEEGEGSTVDVASLAAAVEAAGDPALPIQVELYEDRRFRISATVEVGADHLPDVVLARVRDALAAAFSFDARDFGQGVAASEVVAVVQGVAGVVAVDLDALYRPGLAPSPFLAALPARVVDGQALPAQLLLLALEDGDLTRREVPQ